MTARGRQSGMALLVVLWVISGLSLVVATVLAQTRTDITLTRTHVDLARARAMAGAGVYRGVYALLQRRDKVSFGLPEAALRIQWQDATVSIRVENEAGKIDVNTADPALVRRLFERAGASVAASERLLRRRADRGDQSTVPDKGREFRSIEGFAAALDLPRGVWRIIEPWITVHNGRSGINPWVADEAVLALVPGYKPSLLKHPRKLGAPDRLQSGFMQPDDRYFTDRLSPVYTIAARAVVAGVSTTVEARVEMSADRQRPYTILAWNERPGFGDG